ncbi:MAG TPA: bacillithiol biosynthesis cysteine-adding enzyme BshC [Trueperaceae bacterium]|nr:bacillithiol biosynthesis cysteine-adding enzyme BshC [Trueperaceae bacterium]
MLAHATPPAPSFLDAFLSGQLNDFFELAPGDVSAALDLPRSQDRRELVDALSRYAASLGAPQAVFDNLERLRHPNARAVVTGQQTGLLLGPTYSLSKAATAVALAKRLSTEERPVVPIFWLATQDHDVAEIDHTYLLDGSETLRRIAVTLPAGAAVGRAPLTPELVATVKQGLAQLTPRPRFLSQVWELLAATAGSVTMFSDWFGAILMRLLGDAGLVLIDPMQRDVATLFAPLITAELADAQRTPEAINDAGRRLKSLGYEPQLGRGQDATNLFVELKGRRVLLRRVGAAFAAEDRRFTRAELLAMLEVDPTAITPAAGLRPVIQDATLPTAVFVLGPGELRYVAQLRDVYRFHGVPMPLTWPRASATVLEPVSARLLTGLGLRAVEFRNHRPETLERVLLERHGHAARFQAAASRLEAEFTALLSAVDAIDPTLQGTVRNGHKHLAATMKRLRGKSGAALAKHDATTVRQFERLASHLLPLGQPAERVLSPFSHALKFGIEPLMDRFSTLEPTGDQELVL